MPISARPATGPGLESAPMMAYKVPVIIADAGEREGKRFIEFFTATIHNGYTRRVPLDDRALTPL
jgi:hypothetical protein